MNEQLRNYNIIEKETTTNKDVVRVLPLGMSRPKDIFTILEHTATGNLETDLQNTWFTQSTWIVNSCDQNTTHLMLPGGEIKQKKGQPESIQEAASREVWEELHTPHIDVDDNVLTSRQFSFKTGLHERNEFTIAAQVPPFIKPTNANEPYTVKHIALVNPDELKSLFTDEEYRNIPLIDSLTEEPPMSVSLLPEQTQELKDETIIAAYQMEFHIRKKIFQRYLVNQYGDPHTNTKDGYGYEYEEYMNDIEQEVDQLNERFLQILQEEPDQELVIKNLKIAAEEVYLEESLLYVEHSGSQAAYLIGQIVMDYDTLTPYEMELIKNTAPELHNFYSSIADGYATHLDDPHWYSVAKENIARMRAIKAKPDPYKTEDEIVEYKDKLTKFETSFLSRIGVSSKKELASYSERFDNFLLSLQKTFTKVADRKTASSMFTNKLYTKTSSLEELLFVSQGLSPYREDDDFDMNSPNDSLIRWQALRKIIGTQQMKPIEGIYGEIVGRSIYRFRQAFESTIIPEHNVDIESTPYDMAVTRLRNVGFAFVGKELKPVDLRKVPILFTFAEKSFDSIVRKILERADLTNEDQKEKIDDVLRFAIIAKSEDISEADVPSDDKTGRDRVGKQTVKQLLTDVLGNLIENSNNIQIRKVKSSGAMNTTLPNGTQISLLDEVVSYLKRNTNGRFDKLHIESDGHAGSRASLTKFPWSWLKLVIEVDGIPCELQMYPSVEDFKIKLKDDDRFALDRLHSVHSNDRFPIVDVLDEKDMKDVILRNGKNEH